MKTESAELQELRASVALARTSRLIGAREEKIILGAAALSTRPVREIMLSAESISMLDVQASIGDCLIAAHLDMHTRFPVAERRGDPQSIIGYVNFKDIVALMPLLPNEPSIRGGVRAMPNVDEQLALGTCLEQMMRGRLHILRAKLPDNVGEDSENKHLRMQHHGPMKHTLTFLARTRHSRSEAVGKMLKKTSTSGR